MKLKPDPHKGDKTPRRWESHSCRPPGTMVNTAEFHQNRFAPQGFSENKNIKSRQLKVHYLTRASGFFAFIIWQLNGHVLVSTAPPLPRWVSHQDTGTLFIRTVKTHRYPSSSVEIMRRSDVRCQSGRVRSHPAARAGCVYEQTLQAHSFVCPGRVPGAHTHLARVPLASCVQAGSHTETILP